MVLPVSLCPRLEESPSRSQQSLQPAAPDIRCWSTPPAAAQSCEQPLLPGLGQLLLRPRGPRAGLSCSLKPVTPLTTRVSVRSHGRWHDSQAPPVQSAPVLPGAGWGGVGGGAAHHTWDSPRAPGVSLEPHHAVQRTLTHAVVVLGHGNASKGCSSTLSPQFHQIRAKPPQRTSAVSSRNAEDAV